MGSRGPCFNAVFLGDVFSDTAFLHDECECGRFFIVEDVRRGVGMLKDWQVQKNTQDMASIMSRLADVLRRCARRGLNMLVKPRADGVCVCVCVCRWKGGMCC